jgi:hypothetical protein
MRTGQLSRARQSFGEPFIPPGSPREALGSLIENGGESYIAGQDRKWLAGSPIVSARSVAATLAEQGAKLRRELRATERKLDAAPSTIPIPRKTQDRNWGALVPAASVSLISLLGMTVSTFVLAEYVLKSASDLFAGNVVGAVLVGSLPSQAAVTIKLYEHRLMNPTVRWLYATVLFGLGIAAFGAWISAAAFYFAPQSGGLAAQLLADRSDFGAGYVLLLTTVLCDLSFSYTALAGAAMLWAKSNSSGSAPNPEHRLLFREKVRLERSISECERQRRDAEDYLSRANAARDQTRAEAEALLALVREAWTQRQTAAQSAAITKLLSESETLS